MIPDWRPSFFKIITSKRNHEELRIPPHFRKYASMEMFQKVILRGPSGGHWEVKVQKRSEGIYLEDGWVQFMKDHTLGDDEFLIFKYDGDMLFDVQIFEKSGCERTNESTNKSNLDSACPPSSKSKKGRPRKAEPKFAGQPNVESRRGRPRKVTTDFSCRPNSRRKRGRPKVVQPNSPHFCSESPENIFGGQSSVHEKTKENEQAWRKIEDNIKKGETMKAPDLPAQEPKWHAGRKMHPPSAESIKALKVDNAFSSSYPHFWSCMREYNINNIFNLHIPISFSKLYLPRSKATVTLRNSEGKMWEVRASYSGRHHAFSGGWASFAKYNNIKFGDVCVFELIETYCRSVAGFKSTRDLHLQCLDELAMLCPSSNPAALSRSSSPFFT